MIRFFPVPAEPAPARVATTMRVVNKPSPHSTAATVFAKRITFGLIYFAPSGLVEFHFDSQIVDTSVRESKRDNCNILVTDSNSVNSGLMLRHFGAHQQRTPFLPWNAHAGSQAPPSI